MNVLPNDIFWKRLENIGLASDQGESKVSLTKLNTKHPCIRFKTSNISLINNWQKKIDLFLFLENRKASLVAALVLKLGQCFSAWWRSMSHPFCV